MMGVRFSSILALAVTSVITAQSVAAEDMSRFLEAIQLLERSTPGAKLVQKAMQVWKVKDERSFAHTFEWGVNSKTDTVLTRYYNPVTHEETRERETKVYLRARQDLVDLTLDMAHELVHATSRPIFDPYDASLTPRKYVQAQIEGIGGEVDAVLMECQVAYEFWNKLGIATKRCAQLLYPRTNKNSDELSGLKQKIETEFYRVGRWYTELVHRMGNDVLLIPQLSNHLPRYLSSTGRAPYPIALLNEYEELTSIACKNSKIRILNSQSGAETDDHKKVQVDLSQQFISKRCPQ